MQVALLFFLVLYALVGSMILLGVFWNDARFFWLAGINLLSFLIFFFVYRLLEKKRESVALPPEKEKASDSVYIPPHFVKHPAFHKKHAFFPKRYILGTLVAIFVFVSIMAFRVQITSCFSFLWEKTQEIFTPSEPITSTYMTGEGEVLGSGVSPIVTGNIFIETGEVLLSGSSGNVDGVTQPLTGNVFVSDAELVETGDLEIGDAEVVLPATGLLVDKPQDTALVTMMDAVIYIIKAANIPLATTTPKFTYVSSKNTNYAYWATAYQKRVIGVATNPSSKISCETYQVFKGMLAGWNVKYTSATVKSAYWAEAKKRDELKGCVYGTLLKGKNM